MCFWRGGCWWAKCDVLTPAWRKADKCPFSPTLVSKDGEPPWGGSCCRSLTILDSRFQLSSWAAPLTQKCWALASQCCNGQVAWCFHVELLCGKMEAAFPTLVWPCLWHQRGLAAFASHLMHTEHNTHMLVQAYWVRRVLLLPTSAPCTSLKVLPCISQSAGHRCWGTTPDPEPLRCPGESTACHWCLPTWLHVGNDTSLPQRDVGRGN